MALFQRVSVELQAADVLMNQRWRLRDLGKFPDAMEGAYAFFVLTEAHRHVSQGESYADYLPRPNEVRRRGSLDELRRQLGPTAPTVGRIQYASPGLIEIVGLSAVLSLVFRTVRSAVLTGSKLNQLWDDIVRKGIERDLLREQLSGHKLRLTEREDEVLKQFSRYVLALVSDSMPETLPTLEPFADNELERAQLIRDFARCLITLRAMEAKGLIRLPNPVRARRRGRRPRA